jgi:lysophospholipase L1-like esterase
MPLRLLYLCLIGLLMLPADAPPPPTVLAAVPICRTDLPWWRERHKEKLERIAQGHVDLVFLGDSITQNWERHGPPPWMDFVPIWQKFYGDRNAVNLGFIGDTTANLLWRINNGEVSGISPKVAVILIGTNNLVRTEETVAGIDANIAALEQRLPHTKILLLGILPSDRSAWATETNVAVNRELATKYAHNPVVTFLDLGHVFMVNGKLNRDLFFDPKLTPPRAPLHPTAQGQELMAQTMEPTLSALLGDRAH